MLLACYLPLSAVGIVLAHRQANLSHLVVALGIVKRPLFQLDVKPVPVLLED